MINSIIPVPKSIEIKDETVTVSACISTKYEPWSKYLSTFLECTKKIFKKSASVGEGGIELVFDSSLKENRYRITASDSIKLFASNDKGIAHAIATVLQMISFSDGKFTAKQAEILDYCDKNYRGLMVDLARQWHPVSTVLKYIDVCFLLKLSHIQLHFIDDQLYTLPSKAFPEISTKDFHYSFEDIALINEYASKRAITIIPEFEVPGHATSLVRSYPEIFKNDITCDSASITTENGLVISADAIVCAGKEQCFEAIKALLAEVAEMFPNSPYIHIGGDEANVKAWNYCPHCVKYMKDHNIEDEKDLYCEFTGRVAQIVLDLGRTPIVWEGFPRKGVTRIPKETIVIAWESHYNLAPDLLEDGFKIINCTWQPLYIVPYQHLRWGVKEILDWNVYQWQHWWEHSKATLNPINVAPTDDVLGAQVCAWENTYEREINFVMENCAALSERTWNLTRTVTTAQFTDRLTDFMKILGALVQDI